MKCEIELNWRGSEEEMTLSRVKEPREEWVSPIDGGASVEQVIRVLDNTYADVRAALIAMLPQHLQERVSVVVNTTPEQARRMVEGKA